MQRIRATTRNRRNLSCVEGVKTRMPTHLRPRALLRTLALASLSLLALTSALGPSPLGEVMAEEEGGGPSAPVARPAIERDLEYARVGERALRLDLYRPTTAAPHPVLVWVHGGGWRRGNKSRVALRGLIEHGFAVASVEYRLSGEATYPAAIHDVKAAVRWLRAHGDELGLATKRIGVGGTSAGGHLAALLGTSGGVAALEGSLGAHAEESSRVQAVVDLFGPTDLLRIFDDVANKERAAGPNGMVGRFLGGAVFERESVAREASPTTHITKDDPPFLILHGDRDRVVPVSQSRLFHAALEKAGVSSTLKVLPGSGHGGRAFTSAAMLGEIAAFLRKHLVESRASTDSDAPTSAPTTPSVVADVVAKWSKAGPHAFTVTDDLVLRDAERGKALPVRITWPQMAGKAPVVIWSHGLRGSKNAYEPVAQFLSSHGWVVIQPTHSDSASLGRRAVRGFTDWANRPRDVHFLLDQLDVIAKHARTAGFAGTLDKTRIGMGGHSYGAMTGQLLAGATTRSRDGSEVGRQFFADGRLAAFVLVSPQGRDTLLDEGSWAHIKSPTMVITGTKDGGRGQQPYTWRVEPYTYMPAGSKALAVIDEATHRFGGFASRERAVRQGETNETHVRAVLALTRAFLEAHVLRSAEARALVEGDSFRRSTRPTMRYEHK